MGNSRPERPAAQPPTQEAPRKNRSAHAGRPEPHGKRITAWLTTVQGVVAALTSVVVAVGALVFAVSHFGSHDSSPANTPGSTAAAAPAGKGAAPQSPASVAMTTPAETSTSPDLVPLYTLPANSAGQMGAQQGPIDVTLGGRKSPNSTAVTCGGSVTFHLDGKYRHLVGWAGVADFAPSTVDNLIYIKGDGQELQVLAVSPDKVLPVDLEVTGVKTLELDGSDRGISTCTDGSKTYDYLGDAFVS